LTSTYFRCERPITYLAPQKLRMRLDGGPSECDRHKLEIGVDVGDLQFVVGVEHHFAVFNNSQKGL